MTDAMLVLSTVGSVEDAERIARDLVDNHFAACVNIVPGVTSVYRWKGQVEKDVELLLVIKTSRDRFEGLREALVADHPYEVPEVVAMHVEAGHPPYLAWLAENVAPDRDQ